MKRTYYLILAFLAISTLIVFPSRTFACGTVEDWVKIYFDNQNHFQQHPLSFVHCEHIVFNYYKATPRQHELLAQMIAHALNSDDPCDHNLAIKNFFIYDQLFWLKHMDIHKQIKTDVESILKQPSGKISGSLSMYDFEDHESYCTKVHTEISQMKLGSVQCSDDDKCKRIDLSNIERKAGLVTSFIKETNACLRVQMDNPLDVQVLRVKTERVNVRSKPSTGGKIINTLKTGDFLRVVRSANEWFLVLGNDCQIGWIAGYLTEEGRSLE